METHQNLSGIAYGSSAMSYANQLNLELHECSFANFNCTGHNRYTYNRIFAVQKVTGDPSFVGNSETGRKIEMKPGCFYFSSCALPLSFEFRKGTEFFAFHFNVLHCAYQDIFLSEAILRERHDPEFVEQVAAVFQSSSDLSAAFRIKGLLFLKVAELFPSDKKLFQKDCFEKYRNLFEHIAHHISARLTIDDLAEIAGIPRDRLSRNFSRDIGIPLKKYLSNILLSRAELLLRNKELTVREIARLLNFNDEYYFSHFFRRQTGLAPGQYRKQQIEIFKKQA